MRTLGDVPMAGSGGQIKVMTFEPTLASLDMLIGGLKRSIETGCADHNAGVTLLLAELLQQALQSGGAVHGQTIA
jgi:hypothetical protein